MSTAPSAAPSVLAGSPHGILATSDASAERSASLAAAARMANGGGEASASELQGSTPHRLELRLKTGSRAGDNTSTDGKRSGAARNQQQGGAPVQDLSEDDSYPTFTQYHHSLLKKYLTPEVWSKLSNARTSYGTTIEDIIGAGLSLPIGANPPRRVGVLVGDAECYTVFRDLLDPIISEYHGIDSYEEWADPELPMDIYFKKKRSAEEEQAAAAASSSGGVIKSRNDAGDGMVMKSSGADEDSDEDDDSAFFLDEDDDAFVEDVALPSSFPQQAAAAAAAAAAGDTPPSGRERHVERIASSRKASLRRHPTIINNPRLVTNREADPEGRYIISTRIRVARSLDGVKFPPTMSRSERRAVQRLIQDCTNHFVGPNFASRTYVPVLQMTNDQNLDLIERHILFDNPNEWTIASGLGRDWPDGRALYANVSDLRAETPDFMIWVNEEDHLRIMCLRSGGDIQGVFTTLMNGVRELERELSKRGWQFAYDPRLGYLTSCPTNVGTTMRASVHVRLTNLGRLPGFFELVQRLKLEARGKYGETDRHYTGVFDISNAERLGKSEVHLINVMVEGVAKLIELERRLEAGEAVDIDAIARG